MKELKFDNPVFSLGPNVTVRLGIKWVKEVGNNVKVYKKDSKQFYVAEIQSATVKKFSDVRAWQDHLWLEHDPACRTVLGLKKELSRIYGKKFSPTNSVVTILYFKILPV